MFVIAVVFCATGTASRYLLVEVGEGVGGVPRVGITPINDKGNFNRFKNDIYPAELKLNNMFVH